MRLNKRGQCEKWHYCIPHEPHYWNKTLFTQRQCSGFKKMDGRDLGLFQNSEEAAAWIAKTFAPPTYKQCIGMHVPLTLGEKLVLNPRDHKHKFRYTLSIGTPAGLLLGGDYHYWQCETCWLVWAVHKLDWSRAELVKKVDQTWPQ